MLKNLLKSMLKPSASSHNVYYSHYRQPAVLGHYSQHDYFGAASSHTPIAFHSIQQKSINALKRFFRPCVLHWPLSHIATQKQGHSPARPPFLSPACRQTQTYYVDVLISKNALRLNTCLVHSQTVDHALPLLDRKIARVITFCASLSVRFKPLFNVTRLIQFTPNFFAFNINRQLIIKKQLQFTRPLAIQKPASQGQRFAFLNFGGWLGLA